MIRRLIKAFALLISGSVLIVFFLIAWTLIWVGEHYVQNQDHRKSKRP
jgi:hypothetical protein